jgi:hypothetical protein
LSEKPCGAYFFAFFENFFVPILTSGGLAAVSSSAFAALYSAFGKYDVVHIHAEGPAFFAWLPKMFGKRVVVTVHGIDAGHSFLKNNSRTPNLNLIQSNRKLPTGSKNGRVNQPELQKFTRLFLEAQVSCN